MNLLNSSTAFCSQAASFQGLALQLEAPALHAATEPCSLVLRNRKQQSSGLPQKLIRTDFAPGQIQNPLVCSAFLEMRVDDNTVRSLQRPEPDLGPLGNSW